ncbi:MAG: hypothetical protein HZY73_15015 [Micropruina sp.]|nr:MAG: hypothetical protein HZY73_15015 [Micropruina sp.]
MSVSIKTEPAVRGDRWQAVAWALFGNLVILAGALWFGWPAGNLYLLFWVENVILGVVTLTKLLTLRSAQPARAGFFVAHYGLFCFVHLVFILVVAFANGLALTFWALGLPVILLVVRYGADLWTGWFAGAQRDRAAAAQVFASPTRGSSCCTSPPCSGSATRSSPASTAASPARRTPSRRGWAGSTRRAGRSPPRDSTSPTPWWWR